MRLTCILATGLVALLPLLSVAEDNPAETPFAIGEGKLALKAPAGWKKVQPKSRIIEAEFEIPAAKDDEIAGRLTAMGAGGTVEANIERWVAQFTGEGVKPKVEKKTIGGSEVHVVDLAGTRTRPAARLPAPSRCCAKTTRCSVRFARPRPATIFLSSTVPRRPSPKTKGFAAC
jgi:hypothetical protein